MEAELKLDDIVEAEVTKLTDFGAFVKINGRKRGLIHISQIASNFVKDVKEHLQVGDKVKARVIKLGPGNKIDLSLRIKQDRAPLPFKSSNFEEKLKQFLQGTTNS